jgi:phospholipid/cholesterol/gamma-HCH transport system substrate-binding protein
MANINTRKTFRVGLLVTSALVILMIFVFFIGSEQKVFARKHEYEVRLSNVSGLAQGSPVRMSGVTIGVIRDITLPRDPKQKEVELTVMIDRKFSERVRGDSRVRLKKLGLLTGDSFIEVTPGSPRFPALEPGSMIPSQRGTDVEALISSGEDLVENFVQISYSLKNILARVDRGEGLLGEMTTAPETKQRITDTVLTTLNKTNAALTHMESGKGVLGRLIYDDRYGADLTASIGDAARSLQSVTLNVQRSFETGEGLVPALLNDPQGRASLNELVGNLRTSSANLATFTESLQSGEGLFPRPLNDRASGEEALTEFSLLIRQLNDVVAKINSGEGTAGRLIADPSLYEAVNDILIGINESRMLRWIIRNRQQTGIVRRAEELEKVPGTRAAPAPDPPLDAGAPPPGARELQMELEQEAEAVSPPAATTTDPPPPPAGVPPSSTTNPPR